MSKKSFSSAPELMIVKMSDFPVGHNQIAERLWTEWQAGCGVENTRDAELILRFLAEKSELSG